MRHARQPLAQRRGGDTAGSAWPSIVATTTSLSGAAAGIASLLLWNDPFHLRLGVGMAAAGAVFSSFAMLGVRRDRLSRRELLAEAREDHSAELRFEVTRRDTLISALKQKVLEAEEIVVLFEQRIGEEQARFEASETAREQAEHDLAVLTAWVHQANAAAELTRSAVQSFQTVQPFEPAQAYEPAPAAVQVYEPVAQAVQPANHDFLPRHAEPAAAQYFPTQTPDVNGYLTDEESAAWESNTGYEVDLTPAAAVPLSPILAAAREQSPAVQYSQQQVDQQQPGEPRPIADTNGKPRPLRTAVLAVRDEIGFDVAPDVHSAAADPYLVPGITMPRQREGDYPTRPVAPERLYRPYLGSEGTVDLPMYDETQQINAVDGRRTGTA
jgi:hypothetical protein